MQLILLQIQLQFAADLYVLRLIRAEWIEANLAICQLKRGNFTHYEDGWIDNFRRV